MSPYVAGQLTVYTKSGTNNRIAKFLMLRYFADKHFAVSHRTTGVYC